MLVHIKSDTRPTYTFRLKRGHQALDVTGATVVGRLRKPDGTTVVETACTLVDAAAGIVSLTFQASDVNTVGEHQLEIKVTFSSGGIQHGVEKMRLYVRDEFGEVEQ